MSYWIFKVSDQSLYADVPGHSYLFDNTHSIRVRAGDEFLYLDKRGSGYRLTGAGCVGDLESRRPEAGERRNRRVRTIFIAHLVDVLWFRPPVDLSPRSAAGRKNRRRSDLPLDINKIGWSRSMPVLPEELFRKLLDLGFDKAGEAAPGIPDSDWAVHDSLSLVKARHRMSLFRRIVLARHDYTCVVCGTQARYALEAAHVRSYSSDPSNRANPGNGLCLCRFCHAALDSGQISISPDGRLRVDAAAGEDAIASTHFSAVSADQRQAWLAGVEMDLLSERGRTTEARSR